MKKKTIFLIIIIVTIIGILFSIKTDAGTGKLYTRLTALNLDGVGYGIGDPTNKGKYIWHMSTFDSIKGGVSATQKNIYCLRAEYGASWEEFQGASDILEYNMVFDFQKDRENLSNKIVSYPEDDRDEIVKNIIDENGTQYREILWLLDNMYIVGQTSKEDYLGRVGIKKDVYEGVTEYYNEITGKTYGEEVLTDSDIIAIQRVAIWTITNGEDYDKTSNSHWLRETKDGQDYRLLSESKDSMATDLYKYLVQSARTGAKLYTPENNFSINGVTVGVNLDGITQKDDKYIAQISGTNYIIGPIVLNKNNDLFYEISMNVLDENKTPIEKENYYITDSNGNELNDVELKDFVGKTEGFYIKVPTSLAEKVNIQIQVTQYNTTKNLWLVGTETETQVELAGEQPVAEFSRKPQTTTVEFIAQQEEIETKDIEITKKWDDANNQDGIRPKSVTVILYANGVEIDRKEVTGEGDIWKATFTELPVKEQGKDIIYTIDEDIVPGYEKIINGFEITNKYIPGTTSVRVLKIWDDNNNKDGLRTKSVEINLLKNDVKYKTVELNETNNWQHVFSGLPKKENGKDIIYTIEETTKIDGYKTTITKNQMLTELQYIITNKHETTKIFDLALRKYITKLNGKNLTDIRTPNIDEKSLEKETTAIYKHRKDPVKVKENDIVTYEITIYNEGEKAGYASQIIDQLPEGLIYEPETVVESNKNKYTVTYEAQTNKIILDIINTNENPAKALQPYQNEKIDSETIQLKCKVIHKAKPGETNIITNVAWINEAFDIEENKPITKVGDDRDSEPGTKPNVNKDNMENYKGNDKNQTDLSNSEYFYKGQQDDDDFEKLYVQRFDLSLRKFITSVNGKAPEVSRQPVVDVKPLQDKTNTTAIYTHPKTPILLRKTDTIIYTIRVYNEGEIDGFASEVKDYLPPYLEIVENSEINKKYKWRISEDGRIAKTTYLADKEISAFNGEKLDYEDLQIECRIKSNAIPKQNITNIAEISEYKYEDTVVPEDVDSKSNNIKDNLPEDEKLPDYKKEDENKPYIPGNEDDDDFEKVKVEYFDLSILKFVSKVIINENGEEKITETGYNGHENPEPVVKVELHKKKLDEVIVKFGYGITITNEGDIPGYATEITDYVPQGLKFDPNDNPEWMDEGNNIISTKQLENVLLQPGESKTIEVILTWINGKDNMALKTNTVEISEDKNTNDIPDRDSTPDNQKEGEDDIDIAKVILAISTGRVKTYFTLTLGLLIVIGTGIIIIKKFVI